MKKATKASIAKFAQSYLSSDGGEEYITHENAEKFMSDILSEFSGCFSGISPNKAGNQELIVKSVSTSTKFLTVLVRD